MFAAPSHGSHSPAAFLVSEVAFFSTLIVAYVTFLGRATVGPTPTQALSLKLAFGTTLCLVASSVIIHFAEAALRRGNQAAFKMLWAMTIALGVALGEAQPWLNDSASPKCPA